MVDMSKSLRRGILLKKDKSYAPPKWFAIQYENLPFFWYSCSMISHLENPCPSPRPRDAAGKLPHELKKLRAPDDRRRKAQSFAQAAAKSFGSSSGPGRNRGSTSSLHKSQGIGKETVNDHAGNVGVSDDDPPGSRADGVVHSSEKASANDRPIMVQAPRKRKGPNSKPQEPGPLAIDIPAPASEGQGDKQLV
jgi:hypothetical protein